MRPWESEPHPTLLGGRVDSQDRMDQKTRSRKRVKERWTTRLLVSRQRGVEDHRWRLGRVGARGDL